MEILILLSNKSDFL